MKKALSVIAIIILIGSIYFLRDKLNNKPIPNTIWIEKDISRNKFEQQPLHRDTVKVLEVKGDFLQVKSVAYGLLFSYRLDAFVADYERCAECENIYIKNLER